MADKKQRVNLFLDPGVIKTAKMRAIEESLSLSKLVDKALLEYISEGKINIDDIPPISENET